MRAKEYLAQARSIKIKLEAMSEQLEFLRQVAKYVSPQLSDMPRAATRNVHKGEDAMVRVMEFEARMMEQYAVLDEINEAINSVSNPMAQAILAKRYLGRGTWDEIASALYISRSHLFSLHNDALAEIEKTRLNWTVLDE